MMFQRLINFLFPVYKTCDFCHGAGLIVHSNPWIHGLACTLCSGRGMVKVTSRADRALAKCNRVGHKVKIVPKVATEWVHQYLKTTESHVCSRCKNEIIVYGWIEMKKNQEVSA